MLLKVGGEFGLQDSLLYDRGIAASAVDQIAVASPNLKKPNQNVYTGVSRHSDLEHPVLAWAMADLF